MQLVRDVLGKKGGNVESVTRETTVLEAARRMNERRIGALCVLDGDKVVGMFTERDVLNRVVAQQLDPAATKVGDVMTAPVITCGPNAKLSNCATVMSREKIRHLPVVDETQGARKLVGILSTGDVMAMDLADKQAHIEHLHDYLHGRA